MNQPVPCWQYVVKQREAVLRGVSAIVGIGVEDVQCEALSYQRASAFIKKYEWLGNMGSAQRCYGLVHGGTLLAVACFARAIAPRGFSKLLSERDGRTIFQLVRGATAPEAPAWAGSFLLSRAMSILRKDLGAQVVVAYADPRAGEVGVVYQAANALYLGLTTSRGPGQYVIAGESLHPRTVFRRFGSAKDCVLRTIDPGYVRIQREKKHLYMFILAKKTMRSVLLRSVAHLVKPFPKRM